MRFEKLNENKIRITLTSQELIDKDIDFHSFMSNPIESQDLFLDMLNEAEKEIGFITKNYQIHIEALSVNGGDFIITVTRSIPEKEKQKLKRTILIKRKKADLTSNLAIYSFDSFEDFCSFSIFLKDNQFYTKNIAKSVVLYLYNDTYYLVLNNINVCYPYLKKFLSSITEFGSYKNNSIVWFSKLVESSKVIFKNNAFENCLKYFYTSK